MKRMTLAGVVIAVTAIVFLVPYTLNWSALLDEQESKADVDVNATTFAIYGGDGIKDLVTKIKHDPGMTKNEIELVKEGKLVVQPLTLDQPNYAKYVAYPKEAVLGNKKLSKKVREDLDAGKKVYIYSPTNVTPDDYEKIIGEDMIKNAIGDGIVEYGTDDRGQKPGGYKEGYVHEPYTGNFIGYTKNPKAFDGDTVSTGGVGERSDTVPNIVMVKVLIDHIGIVEYKTHETLEQETTSFFQPQKAYAGYEQVEADEDFYYCWASSTYTCGATSTSWILQKDTGEMDADDDILEFALM